MQLAIGLTSPPSSSSRPDTHGGSATTPSPQPCQRLVRSPLRPDVHHRCRGPTVEGARDAACYRAPMSLVERATSKLGERLDIHGRQLFPPEMLAGRRPELATESPGPMSWKHVDDVDLKFRLDVRPPGRPSADEPDHDVVHDCDEVDLSRVQGTGFQRSRPPRDTSRQIGRRPLACERGVRVPRRLDVHMRDRFSVRRACFTDERLPSLHTACLGGVDSARVTSPSARPSRRA